MRSVLVCLLALATFACSSGSDSGAGHSPGPVPGSSGSGAAKPAYPPGLSYERGTLSIDTETATAPPGSEVYKCQDFKNPWGQDMAITVTESEMTKGSHHLFVFKMADEDLDLDHMTDCPAGGLEFHDFIHASQTPKMVVPNPPGVGHLIPAGTGFRVNLHLLNTSEDTAEVFVKLKMTVVEPSQVTERAASMFLNFAGLSVPPGKSTTRASFTVPYDIHLMGALSHMHRQGVHFTAETGDGTQLFETTNWLDPTPRVFDPPLLVQAGTDIRWACDYVNETSRTLTFGESAGINEMCIFPGTFYGGDGSGLVPVIF
jgi:hypothetical protein